MRRQRLQKFLAARGIASRRRAEQMILQGRVSVNGSTVREMGVKIDPEQDRVLVDGQPVGDIPKLVYFALNKPTEVISSTKDRRGRRTVIDLLSGVEERVYPVGRLDYDSEGLVLLTNDGALAARVMHPRYGVSKVYRVWVDGCPAAKIIHQLRSGVELTDGLTAPAQVRVIREGVESTELELEICEGRNRQIRRMCEAVGHVVTRLQRVKIGPLSLGTLPAGRWRSLTNSEVRSLYRVCGLERPSD